MFVPIASSIEALRRRQDIARASSPRPATQSATIRSSTLFVHWVGAFSIAPHSQSHLTVCGHRRSESALDSRHAGRSLHPSRARRVPNGYPPRPVGATKRATPLPRPPAAVSRACAPCLLGVSAARRAGRALRWRHTVQVSSSSGACEGWTSRMRSHEHGAAQRGYVVAPRRRRRAVASSSRC